MPEAPPEAPIIAETPPIPAPAIAPAIAEAAKKGKFIMTDALETAKTYAEEAKTRIQSAVAEMNEKAKVAMEKSSKAMEELGELTKGNYEAVVESSKIAAKGMEALSQEAVEFGRKSFEKSTATFKSLAAVKSPAEFFQLQSELLSTAMDSFASEASQEQRSHAKAGRRDLAADQQSRRDRLGEGQGARRLIDPGSVRLQNRRSISGRLFCASLSSPLALPPCGDLFSAYA